MDLPHHQCWYSPHLATWADKILTMTLFFSNLADPPATEEYDGLAGALAGRVDATPTLIMIMKMVIMIMTMTMMMIMIYI